MQPAGPALVAEKGAAATASHTTKGLWGSARFLTRGGTRHSPRPLTAYRMTFSPSPGIRFNGPRSLPAGVLYFPAAIVSSRDRYFSAPDSSAHPHRSDPSWAD